MTNKPKIPRNVLIVAFVAFASGFGQDMITPIFPAFLTLLHMSRTDIGLIDGLLQGTTSIFQFVSGILSDKFRKRKWFVFTGYALSSIARPLLAFGSLFAPIATLRIIDGIGKGTKSAPRDALIADSADIARRGRAFGFQRFIDTAGSVLGPLTAAGLLAVFGVSLMTYRTIFALTAIPGAIALALIFFGIREPEKRTEKPRGEKIRFSPYFWVFTIGMAIATFAKINDSLFLVRAHDIGIPHALTPILFAGFTLIYAGLSYPIGIWSDRFGKLPCIMLGWLVLGAVEIGFAHVSSVPLALVLFAFYGLFFALTEGSARAIISDIVPADARASAYAIYFTIMGLSVIGGGYGLGHIWDTTSPQTTFQLASIGSFFGFFILLFLFVSQKKQ